MKKIYLLFISCMLAFSGLPVCAFAAENGAFLEGYDSEDGKLRIFCSDIVPEEETAEGCEISLGGQGLTVLSAEGEKKCHTPITYYCLADVSGSMGEAQMAQMREALLAVADGMKDGDNMVVGTLGNQIQTGEFLTDRDELRGIVEALEAGREDTNLYAGIVEGIRVLQTEPSVNPRKCLVVLSDGEDDQKTGITQDEAERAVANSTIPVYTVATLKDADDEAGVSHAKLLGSFARMSTGGAHFAPALDGSTGEQAGQSVVLGMEAGFVVTVELSEEMPDKDELLLRMVYTAADNTVYEDTLAVYTEDLDRGEGEEESEPVSEKSNPSVQPTPSLPSEPEPEPWLITHLPWLIGAAVALIVLIVLGIVLMRRRHKKNGKEEQVWEGMEDTSGGEDMTGVVNVSREKATEKKGTPSYELRLYAIGYSDIVHIIRLEQGRRVTVGRNARADVILDREDKKLSGIQCSMLWDNGRLYVWDMDSTNGTFVNGVSIKPMGRVVVHDGETIRMGSYEYRVGRR